MDKNKYAEKYGIDEDYVKEMLDKEHKYLEGQRQEIPIRELMQKIDPKRAREYESFGQAVQKQELNDPNLLIGRMTTDEGASGMYNPYAPTADLVYQRGRILDKINAHEPLRDKNLNIIKGIEGQSEAELIKNEKLGDKAVPRVPSYAGNPHGGAFAHYLSRLNEIDEILGERIKEDKTNTFSNLKKLIDESRKKLKASPVDKLK